METLRAGGSAPLALQRRVIVNILPLSMKPRVCMALQCKLARAAAAGVACRVTSGLIVMHAVMEWPTRYRLHAPSWSLSIYFVIFVTIRFWSDRGMVVF